MTLSLYTHEYFMKEALKEALKGKQEGEIPVGAVVVCQKRIIARAYNQTEKLMQTSPPPKKNQNKTKNKKRKKNIMHVSE